MKLREHLQKGTFRVQGTVLVSILTFCCVYYFWPSDISAQKRLLDTFPKIAFVVAAFGVTAYNLRTRVVDFALKVDKDPESVEEICMLTRMCGERLTNLVLIFMATALWMGGIGLFNQDEILIRLACSASALLLSSSIVSFVYIIFSFELLEKCMLNEAERVSKKKEIERLFPNKSDGS